MEPNTVARVLKMPSFDMITKSVSEIKRDYSKIIREIENEYEPAFVMNHNTPEAVIMSYEYYKNVLVDTRTMIETVMKELEALEDEALYAKAANRLSKDNQTWLTSEQVLGTKEKNEDNPYRDLDVYRIAGKRVQTISDTFAESARWIERMPPKE